MNIDELLARAKDGERFDERTLRILRDELSNDDSRVDTYTLVHVLWKAGDVNSTPIIARTTTHADEMVRRIALQALAELEPSERVFELALTMASDSSKYVRMAATRVVGTLRAALSQCRQLWRRNGGSCPRT